MSEGSIITFYSYKGGVGRTLALTNIGALLSLWGFKVLCIDWDLEAPGLHLYFDPWIVHKNTLGLTELIQAHADETTPDWQNYVTQVQLPGTREPLSLITAGIQDDSYVRRMQALNWKDLYETKNLGNFLENIRQEWKENFDFILLDSRTGITDIGGICTVQLPDYLVLLFTANFQSLRGAIDVSQRASILRNSLPYDRSKLLVLPVATRFEARIEYELAQQWLANFATELAPLYEDWVPRGITASDLLNYTRVPYIPYWSFGEKLPVLEKGTQDPEDIGYSLENLAALVSAKLTGSDLLINNRDSFVGAARKGPSRQETMYTETLITPHERGIKVFISYSYKDKPIVDEFKKHLMILKRQRIIERMDDKQISPGTEYTEEINRNLYEADIFVMMVSPDLLVSEYAWGSEFALAQELQNTDQLRILPIILRPTDWLISPLAKFQVLPKDGRPVTLWNNRDEAWLDIVRGIRDIATQIASGHSVVL